MRSGRRKPGAPRPGRPSDDAAAAPVGAEAPLHPAEGEGFAPAFGAGEEPAAVPENEAAAHPRLRLVELDPAPGGGGALRGGESGPSITLGTVAGGLDGSADDALLLESLADPGPLPFDDPAAGTEASEADWLLDEEEPEAEDELTAEDDAVDGEEDEGDAPTMKTRSGRIRRRSPRAAEAGIAIETRRS